MVWEYYAGEWYFIAQVSASNTLGDIKIDPLRGHAKQMETAEECATRELFEESSRLFDFRRSETVHKIIRNQKLEIFHFQIRFRGKSINPAYLIEQYRRNRRTLQGCDEVLDLAVEPFRRRESPNIYPRLSTHTIDVFRNKIDFENPAGLPVVNLCMKDEGGITCYHVEDVEVCTVPSTPKRNNFPLLRNNIAWEHWIKEHDKTRQLLKEVGCAVYMKSMIINEFYKFVPREDMPAHRKIFQKVKREDDRKIWDETDSDDISLSVKLSMAEEKEQDQEQDHGQEQQQQKQQQVRLLTHTYPMSDPRALPARRPTADRTTGVHLRGDVEGTFRGAS